MELNAHSTRLFPKNQGAPSYQVTGVAARCDWVLLTDGVAPCALLHKNKQTDTPRHIFLSMRSPFVALEVFLTTVLPKLHSRFVLITASEDFTLPHQQDTRWRKLSEEEKNGVKQVLESPLLIHWFCENLDDDTHPLMSPLPTGMVFPRPEDASHVSVPSVSALRDRPLRVLCAHRVRNGPQWAPRRRVSEFARTSWSDWCTVLDEEVSGSTYFEAIEQHAFVLCVEGGGLDPSPKAWHTILHGAIPIVRRTALASAYRELPVAFVPEWSADCLSRPILENWFSEFAGTQDAGPERRRVLERLGAEYWWNKIQQKVEEPAG